MDMTPEEPGGPMNPVNPMEPQTEEPPISGGFNPEIIEEGMEEECQEEPYEGMSSTLDMVMMMDRSGSMVGFDGFGNMGANLWIPIGSALGQFVVRGDAERINASIQFYPLPIDAPSQILDPTQMAVCDVAQYANPAAAMGPLPANGPMIQTAIQNNNPLQGGTPTRPALEGATQYAQSIAQQNPSHKVIIVLATDGAPNDCQSDLNTVSTVAQNAFMAGIEVYVIGIGNINGLNQIAYAGGTRQAIVVDSDPNVAAEQFLQAMNEIRTRAIPCDYGLPPAAAANPDLVQLKYTPTNGTEVLITKLEGVDGCATAPDGKGWYYDNPAAPNRILTCDTTCNDLLSLEQVNVSVVVTCEQTAG